MQAAEHHVGQHLARDVARRNRRGLFGVEDAVLRRGDADDRQRAFVVRHLGRHDAFHAEGGIGLGVAERHVDAEARRRREVPVKSTSMPVWLIVMVAARSSGLS